MICWYWFSFQWRSKKIYLSSYNNGIVYFSGRLEDLQVEIDFSLHYESVFASQVNNSYKYFYISVKTQAIAHFNLLITRQIYFFTFARKLHVEWPLETKILGKCAVWQIIEDERFVVLGPLPAMSQVEWVSAGRKRCQNELICQAGAGVEWIVEGTNGLL